MSLINLSHRLGLSSWEVTREQVSIGGSHMGAHGHAFDLEKMMGVEGEVVVGKDKLC